MARRDPDPEWWDERYTVRWEEARALLRKTLEENRTEADRARERYDTTRQSPLGRRPRAPANQAGEPHLGGRHQQPVGIGPALSGGAATPASGHGGKAPARAAAWDEAEAALRYGFGAAVHFRGADWDEQLERFLERDWTAHGDGRPWRESREEVRRGFLAARQRAP